MAGSALGGIKDPTLIYVGVLESRTVADDLIQQFDLAKIYKTKKLSQTENVLKAHTNIVAGKDSIVVITVKENDPKLAADLANAYLASCISRMTGLRLLKLVKSGFSSSSNWRRKRICWRTLRSKWPVLRSKVV